MAANGREWPNFSAIVAEAVNRDVLSWNTMNGLFPDRRSLGFSPAAPANIEALPTDKTFADCRSVRANVPMQKCHRFFSYTSSRSMSSLSTDVPRMDNNPKVVDRITKSDCSWHWTAILSIVWKKFGKVIFDSLGVKTIFSIGMFEE